MDKEQITFDGIPIPLTLETILNAMVIASSEMDFIKDPKLYHKRNRQTNAFRARILRLDNESREAIAIYITTVKDLNIKLSDKLITIYELEQRIAEIVK